MNYPYANGVISSIDRKIFDKADFAKLIKTNKDSFLKTLNDLGYGKESLNLEEMIQSELIETRKKLEELMPNQMLSMFFFTNDAINIKAMYKNRIYNNNFDIFINNGIYKKDILNKVIFNNEYDELDNKQKQLFIKIEENILNENNPRKVSAIIDNLIYDYLFSQLKMSNKKILKKYFQFQIDITNILSILRIKNLNWDYQIFSEMFIEKGNIEKDVFSNLLIQNNETIIKIFTRYFDKINRPLKDYFENHNFSMLENNLDSLILDMMKESAFESLSVGPILFYYLKKLAEAKNIKLIYAHRDIDFNQLIDY